MGLESKTNVAEAGFPVAEEEVSASLPSQKVEKASPSPPSPPPAPAVRAPLQYTVQGGDSLYRIVVRAYGKAPASLIQAIADENHLRDPSQLKVGDVLILPELPDYPTPQKP